MQLAVSTTPVIAAAERRIYQQLSRFRRFENAASYGKIPVNFNRMIGCCREPLKSSRSSKVRARKIAGFRVEGQLEQRVRGL